MALQILQAIPSILAIVLCLIILVLLVLNYFINRFGPTILFILFFTGILLWAGTKLTSIYLPETTNTTFVLNWKMGSLSLLILSLLAITYFRDLLMNDTIGSSSVFVTFLAGITLASIFFGKDPITGNDMVTVNYNAISGWNTDYEYFFLGILLVYLLVVYVYMFIMLIKGLRKAVIKKQRKQIILIITGMAIASIGGTAVNFALNSIDALKSFGDFDLIFVVIGFALVAFAYIRSPIQIYFAPVTAYRLLVMNNDGLPLLTHDFSDPSEKALTTDSTLISGALSGIVNLLKETLSSEHTPTTIQLENRVLLLEKSDSALYALIAEKNVNALRSALKDFAKEFEKDYKYIIKDWRGLTEVFDKAYTLIVEDFAFIISSNPATTIVQDYDEEE
ncbi:MAG: hypothetical protein ACTSO7_17470 [Candidatus Heimdallarchaeota archaeon]